MKHCSGQISAAAFLLFSIFTSEAQKIDLDKRTVKNETILLPSDGALAPLNSYSVDFQIDPVTRAQLGLRPETVDGFFHLEGFSYTTEKPDFQYSIEIGALKQLQSGIEERKQEVKNAAGEMVATTRYLAVVKQALPTTITLKNLANGSVIYTNTFATESTPVVFQSSDFDTKGKADILIDHKAGNLNTNVKSMYMQMLTDEVTNIKNTYTFRKKEYTDTFWEIDINKAPEQAQFNQELMKAITILEKASYKQGLEKAKEEFVPIMKYWSESANEIQTDDKKSKKLKYGHLINMAKSQFWMEMYDECENTCKLLIKNDYDARDASVILSDVANVKASYKQSGLNSRHFYRAGFDSKSRFSYTAPVVAAADPKKPFSIKGEMSALKNSVSEIKNDIKKDFGKRPIKTVKDSVVRDEPTLASIKYTYNGVVTELKQGEFYRGSGTIGERESYIGDYEERGRYRIYFGRNAPKASKGQELVNFDLRLNTNYTYSKNFDADSVIALLKKYENTDLTHINTVSNDSIDFWDGQNFTKPKIIKGKDYKKKLSVSARMDFATKNGGKDDFTNCITVVGDKFKVQFIEATPVNILGINFDIKKAYLVKIRIPELVLNKVRFLLQAKTLYDTIKLENVECSFLMLSYK